MTTYTTQPGESFDAEILRQELVAAIGDPVLPSGGSKWHIDTAGNTVIFFSNYIGTGQKEYEEPDNLVEPVILAHFANSAKRDHNKAIDSDIQDMEAKTPITHRTLREFMLGTQKLIAQSVGITEAQMLDPQSPNYSHAYAKFKAFNDATVTKRQGRINS